MTRLLARYADNVFWLARYVERAENLARILDVQETFARDSRGTNDWRVVLEINADTERFLATGAEPTADAVLDFYVLDRGNHTSLISAIHQARENARALRPLISTEMWIQLNVFYNRMAALRPEEVSPERLSRVCAMVKEGCDAHAGITAGTFYQDEAWSFYRLGAALECADQTTRLLDAKFLGLKAREHAEPGSAADISYWTALLRSAAGYQAFRRRYPRGTTPDQLVSFLVCDPCFPRSVAYNVGVITDELTRLRRHYRLKAAAKALERIDKLTAGLDVEHVARIMTDGEVHQLTDWVQRYIADLTELIVSNFFGRDAMFPPRRTAPAERPVRPAVTN